MMTRHSNNKSVRQQRKLFCHTAVTEFSSVKFKIWYLYALGKARMSFTPSFRSVSVFAFEIVLMIV